MHRFDVAFQNAVKLESLAVGDANATVQRALLRELVDAQPLLRADDAARQAAAQHHGVARLQLLLGAFSANIAVILLIHAVKTDQQEVVAVEAAGQAVVQIFGDGAAQEVALLLHALRIGQFAFDYQRPGVFITHQ